MLRVFEAFSGVGSQRMALRNIGIPHEVVGISDIDKYALKSYEAIHGDCPNFGDISKINPKELPDFDLFTYSFPCQDISVAGSQSSLKEGSGTRSSLLWECCKIIEGKRPKFLLMENVKNLVGKKHKEHFDKFLNYLEGQGYTNYWKVLNAKDYGVPQNRERVFCVSILGEHKPFEFPLKKDLEIKLKDVLEEEVDEKFYISQEKVETLIRNENNRLDLSKNVIGTCHKKNDLSFATRDKVYNENNESPTLTATMYKDAPKILEARACITPDRINKRQNGRRFKEDGEPMFTITTQDKHGVLVKNGK